MPGVTAALACAAGAAIPLTHRDCAQALTLVTHAVDELVAAGQVPSVWELVGHIAGSRFVGLLRLGGLVRLVEPPRDREELPRAREFEQPALALTDHGVMFGAWIFQEQARKAGLKPIVGMEAYVAPGSRFDKSGALSSKEATYHLTLLAQNATGFRNLVKLSSAGFLDGYKRGTRYYLNWREDGQQFRRSLGEVDRKAAEAIRAEKEAELHGLIAPTRGITVGAVLASYLDWYRTARPTTYKRAVSALRGFRAAHDHLAADSLPPAAIERWAAVQDAPGTTEKAMKLARAAFKAAGVDVR